MSDEDSKESIQGDNAREAEQRRAELEKLERDFRTGRVMLKKDAEAALAEAFAPFLERLERLPDLAEKLVEALNAGGVEGARAFLKAESLALINAIAQDRDEEAREDETRA